MLSQIKAKISYKKFVIDKKKAKNINIKIKQIDKKQKKILLNAVANKIRKEVKNKITKNK